MGLKQDIVIKSEFTNNAKGRGSRGATPGQYVMRYMAREDATEVLAPVRIGFDSDAFVRYMIREQATEELKAKQDEAIERNNDAHGSPALVKHRFKQIEKLSGRAFGSRGLSLSHDQLLESSRVIQQAFDEGHSVQKIVLSFTEEYLRETGVLNPNFKYSGRGSYKGQIDQLKLRQAISKGVEQMTKTGKFINPEWVGTIQLDTAHVHAHIALVDTEFSRYRMKQDGADRGKINEREKKMFRKGIHFALEDMKSLKSFHKQVDVERQNVVAFVKDYAYSVIKDNASMQLLIASLPENRKHWRYGTNRKGMKQANKIATSIIERVFQQEPDRSGYTQAMNAIYQYADESAKKNKLSRKEKQQLIKNGREKLVERSVNALYDTIKQLDKRFFHVRTPMIDIQSSSDEELAQALVAVSKKKSKSSEFDPVSFMLRVRGYHDRQEIHKNEAKELFELIEGYDDAFHQGLVDDTAHVMRLYYEEELQYHMGLTDKYRKFLSFDTLRDKQMVESMMPKYESLVYWYEQIQLQEERRGFSVQKERDDYTKALRDYTFECFEKGVASLREWQAIVDYDRENGTVTPRFVLPTQPRTSADNLTDYHFNQVKALDVHHLGLDYYNHPNARIDQTNTLRFAKSYEWRKFRAELAKVYVDGTGQQLDILDRSLRDIEEMESAVKKAVEEGFIQVVTPDDLAQLDEQEKRQLYTIAVDHHVDVAEHIRNHIEHITQDDIKDLENR